MRALGCLHYQLISNSFPFTDIYLSFSISKLQTSALISTPVPPPNFFALVVFFHFILPINSSAFRGSKGKFLFHF